MHGFQQGLKSMARVQQELVTCPQTMDSWWTNALSPPKAAPADQAKVPQISRMGFAHLVKTVGESSKQFPTIADACNAFSDAVVASEQKLIEAQAGIRKTMASKPGSFGPYVNGIVGHIVTWRDQADLELSANRELQELFKRYGSRSAKDYREVLKGFQQITGRSRALMQAIIEEFESRPPLWLFW